MALEHIREQYTAFPGPPEDVCPRGSLRELCGACPMHGMERADLASYSEDKVSWPAEGTAPVSLESALQPADA
eukprot:2013038-Pyramimonas_sp.AAC.1